MSDPTKECPRMFAATRIGEGINEGCKLERENAALWNMVKAAEVILGLWSETELDPEDEEYEAWMAAYSESVTGWLTEARAALKTPPLQDTRK